MVAVLAAPPVACGPRRCRGRAGTRGSTLVRESASALRSALCVRFSPQAACFLDPSGPWLGCLSHEVAGESPLGGQAARSRRNKLGAGSRWLGALFSSVVRGQPSVWHFPAAPQAPGHQGPCPRGPWALRQAGTGTCRLGRATGTCPRATVSAGLRPSCCPHRPGPSPGVGTGPLAALVSLGWAGPLSCLPPRGQHLPQVRPVCGGVSSRVWDRVAHSG